MPIGNRRLLTGFAMMLENTPKRVIPPSCGLRQIGQLFRQPRACQGAERSPQDADQHAWIHGWEAVAFVVDLGHDARALIRDRQALLTSVEAINTINMSVFSGRYTTGVKSVEQVMNTTKAPETGTTSYPSVSGI